MRRPVPCMIHLTVWLCLLYWHSEIRSLCSHFKFAVMEESRFYREMLACSPYLWLIGIIFWGTWTNTEEYSQTLKEMQLYINCVILLPSVPVFIFHKNLLFHYVRFIIMYHLFRTRWIRVLLLQTKGRFLYSAHKQALWSAKHCILYHLSLQQDFCRIFIFKLQPKLLESNRHLSDQMESFTCIKNEFYHCLRTLMEKYAVARVDHILYPIQSCPSWKI